MLLWFDSACESQMVGRSSKRIYQDRGTDHIFWDFLESIVQGML